MAFADKGCQGARGSVRTPFKQRRFRPKLSCRQQAVNRAHEKMRARGERAIATLQTWKTLAKVRCFPRRATAIVHAILVLQATDHATDRTAIPAEKTQGQAGSSVVSAWSGRKISSMVRPKTSAMVNARGRLGS
jgi:DDE superfamily endonuclease